MQIIKPTFIIDKKKCIDNIKSMMQKSKDNNLWLRPHFKTHQSAEVGNLFKEQGINKITVSSFDMAEYFANNGWNDITVAFPVNLLEINTIIRLAKNIKLNLVISDSDSIKFLNTHLKNSVGVFIKIDTGYHRTGILFDNIKYISRLIDELNSTAMEFKGFLTHAGQTYNAKNKQEILDIHNQTISRMQNLKSNFAQHEIVISIGNTPSCSISENFSGIDEIRPGNFVYYDLTQSNLGSCQENDISVALACPIVYKNKDRSEIVVYGGGIHLSKEYLEIKGQKTYGKIVKLNKFCWSKSLENCFVEKLSQEHGIISVSAEHFDDFQIGDIIGILPIHSCMTANLMKHSVMFI